MCALRLAEWNDPTTATIDGVRMPVIYRHHYTREEINQGEWFNCVKYHVIASRNERRYLPDYWLYEFTRLLKLHSRIMVATHDYHSAMIFEVCSFDTDNRTLYVTFADKYTELVRLEERPENHYRLRSIPWTPWGWREWRKPIDGEYIGMVRDMLPRERHFERRENHCED